MPGNNGQPVNMSCAYVPNGPYSCDTGGHTLGWDREFISYSNVHDGMANTTQGLVIANADPNSDAGAKGLGRGTVIVSANGRSVATVEDLESTVRAAKSGGREAVLLRVRVRGSQEVSVPVRLR